MMEETELRPENPNAPPDTHLDLMVDIETLGTKPGCVVLSAAGVWFDRQLSYTYVAFNDTYAVQDMLARDLTVDERTAKWWFEQPNFMQMVKRMALTVEVGHSRTFIQSALKRAARIWSCGPDFDPPILSHALDLDWPFWKNRDVRTMRDMLIYEPGNEASHDPLEDCYRQITVVRDAWIAAMAPQPPGSAGNLT